MRTRFAIKVHALLEQYFPERRVFLKSDNDTRFIRLRPATQLIAFAGSSFVVAWAIVATAILLMDSIGSGNFREQAKRDQRTYQARLNDLAGQRDARAEEALAAQERFNAALEQISVMQSELLASETRRRELETGIEVIQTTLRDTMQEREAARSQVAALEEQGDGETALAAAGGGAPMDFVAEALAKTAAERLAWSLAQEEDCPYSLTTLLPGVTMGPMREHRAAASLAMVTRLIRGLAPAQPNFGFTHVDVRDVARCHVDALEKDQAKGERIALTNGFLWYPQIASFIEEKFPELELKTRRMPSAIVRIFAPYKPRLRSFAPHLDRHADVSNA